MKMEEETRDALLPGGWLRSGDVATIDADHEPNVSLPASGSVGRWVEDEQRRQGFG